MGKKIFKNSSKDTYLILYTLIMFSIPIILAFYTPNLFWLSIITFFHIWLIVNGQNSSMHHHTHWATFNNNRLNRIYDVFLSITFGIATSLWRWSHLLHHKHVNDKPVNGVTQDPVSVYKLSPADGTLNNFWVYSFKGAFLDNILPVLTWYKFGKYKQLMIETWAFRLFIITVFLINPFYGAWLLGTYCLSFIVNNMNSYGEHWGALNRRGDTTQDSIGIYSKWYNIFGFGAGLHQEHHHKPGVHWTQLHTVTPLLHPDRVIKKHGVHITNNPFWEHFVLLLKKEEVTPK
jgi:fatty acid desaturase